jgi:hypothetical protein
MDGKKIPLTFAYAVLVDDAETEGLVGAGPRNYYVLVLSDRELPAGDVNDRFAPQSSRISPGQMMAPLSKTPADSMYGIMLQIDKTKFTILNTQFLHPNAGINMSVVGTQYPDVVKNVHESDGKLIGEASVTTQDTGLDSGPKHYRYSAQFTAPLVPEAAITANLTGAAALACDPVAALKLYLAAAHKGDKTALKSLTDNAHLAYLDKPEVIKFLKDADPKTLTTQLHRVVVRGNMAGVVLVNSKQSYSYTTMHLTQESGAWKVCWP